VDDHFRFRWLGARVVSRRKAIKVTLNMTTFSSKLFRSILFAAVVAASAAVGQAGVVVLEGPYAGMADSPFRGVGERLIVEDFEDGALTCRGSSAVLLVLGGRVCGRGQACAASAAGGLDDDGLP
jgi:hypothetical protein